MHPMKDDRLHLSFSPRSISTLREAHYAAAWAASKHQVRCWRCYLAEGIRPSLFTISAIRFPQKPHWKSFAFPTLKYCIMWLHFLQKDASPFVFMVSMACIIERNWLSCSLSRYIRSSSLNIIGIIITPICKLVIYLCGARRSNIPGRSFSW